jgi:hypothetical protein
MALNFPNRSRSYDATRRAVRFWGHDGPMEAAFFVNEDALRRIAPGVEGDEAGLLGAFDSHLEMIHVKIYMRARKGSYELIPADF